MLLSLKAMKMDRSLAVLRRRHPDSTPGGTESSRLAQTVRRSAEEGTMQDLSDAQVRYILGKALEERRLTDGVITGYLRQLDEEIRDVEQRLQLLRGAAGAAVPVRSLGAQVARRPASGPKAAPSPALRPQNRATAKNTRSQKLQGQYIGFLRQLPLKDRPKYQEIARKHGREQAIVAIRKALGK